MTRRTIAVLTLLLLPGLCIAAENVKIDGRWSVEGLSPGTWTIEAHLGHGIDPPSFSKRIEIPPGVPELHLELTFADGEQAEEIP